MDFDAVIIGGGVVGLAILSELAGYGHSVVLLERHAACGRETSSRNSEVLHGGMYYAANSLKARLCPAGRRAAYAFMDQAGVAYRKTGKLIVAADHAEEDALRALLAAGRENGVEGLRLVSPAEAAVIAPGVKAKAGLFSPESGVMDAHGFMHALEKKALTDDGIIVCGATMTALRRNRNEWTVEFNDSGGLSSLAARIVVNAAGLEAQTVMRLAGMDPALAGLRLHPCKGNYFAVHGESRKHVAMLIYPVPGKNLSGLGVHTVVDVAGGVKLGPDAEYVDIAPEYDYAVSATLHDAFYEAAGRYLPFLRREDLAPDMSGIRPKLSGPGQPARDFHIAHEAERGLPGFINLAGIESPGLTASLAIGSYVRDLAESVLL